MVRSASSMTFCVQRMARRPVGESLCLAGGTSNCRQWGEGTLSVSGGPSFRDGPLLRPSVCHQSNLFQAFSPAQLFCLLRRPSSRDSGSSPYSQGGREAKKVILYNPHLSPSSLGPQEMPWPLSVLWSFVCYQRVLSWCLSPLKEFCFLLG